MITDDTGTPGAGNWELNVAATAVHGHSSTEGELPLLDINYGVGSRIQLKYEVAWVAQEQDGHTRSGLGNSLLGVKWRFWDSGERNWRISTYPQIELRNPRSHSVRRGLAEDGTGVLLPLEFERTVGPVGVNFEVGHELRSRGNDALFGGVVVGREVSDSTEFMAELHGESSGSTQAVSANVGVRFAINELGTLLLSVGRDLHDGFENRSSFFGYLGWQITTNAP